eukprot:COSAG01_NODE_10671_length_2108_cov_1.217023_3_plen_353_part_00
MGKWVKLFFVINGNTVSSYENDQQDGDPTYQIKVSDCAVRLPKSERKGRPWVFRIDTSTKDKLMVDPADQSGRERWIIALGNAGANVPGDYAAKIDKEQASKLAKRGEKKGWCVAEARAREVARAAALSPSCPLLAAQAVCCGVCGRSGAPAAQQRAVLLLLLLRVMASQAEHEDPPGLEAALVRVYDADAHDARAPGRGRQDDAGHVEARAAGGRGGGDRPRRAREQVRRCDHRQCMPAHSVRACPPARIDDPPPRLASPQRSERLTRHVSHRLPPASAPHSATRPTRSLCRGAGSRPTPRRSTRAGCLRSPRARCLSPRPPSRTSASSSTTTGWSPTSTSSRTGSPARRS